MIVTQEITLDQETHTYRNEKGEEVPGVTNILKAGGFIDDRFYSESARQRGTAVHLALHFLEKGTLDPFSVDKLIDPYIESYQKFKEVSGYKVLYHEKIVLHPGYGYAGSLDQVGLLNDAEVLIDFKTGEIQPWHALQTALYNAALPPLPDAHVRKRFALRLYPDGSMARAIPFEDPLDYAVAVGAVQAYYWKLKRGALNGKQAA